MSDSDSDADVFEDAQETVAAPKPAPISTSRPPAGDPDEENEEDEQEEDDDDDDQENDNEADKQGTAKSPQTPSAQQQATPSPTSAGAKKQKPFAAFSLKGRKKNKSSKKSGKKEHADSVSSTGSATPNEDAADSPVPPEEQQIFPPSAFDADLDLDNDLADVVTGLDLFLNSKFEQAENHFKQKWATSLYYCLGYATILWLKACMTFDPTDVKMALAKLKAAHDFAETYRKRNSVFGAVSSFMKSGGATSGASLTNMTRLQRHAELIFAEVFLLKAILTLATTDDGLVSFVREGINIRNAYAIFKNCLRFLNKRVYGANNPAGAAAAAESSGNTAATASSSSPSLPITNQSKNSSTRARSQSPTKATNDGDDNDEFEEPTLGDLDDLASMSTVDPHFTSGVNHGIGAFNLMISLLPARALRIIEFAGFSGDRDLGMRSITLGSESKGVRGPLCTMMLLAYHTVIADFVMLPDANRDLAKKLLDQELKKYPNGAIHLYYSARFKNSGKNPQAGLAEYQRSINSQSTWIQLQDVCYWDMTQCYASIGNYEEAGKCVDVLLGRSKWSKCAYQYIRTALLYEHQLKIGDVKIDEITEMLNKVPTLRRKIAGRSIPFEKFAARKARKFQMQKSRLCHPTLELFLIWNVYERTSEESLRSLLKTVDSDPLMNSTGDDGILLLLIRAVILRFLGETDTAISELRRIQSRESELTLDHWYAPFARLELGKTLLKGGKFVEARKELEDAKNYKTGYSMESQIQFRVHNALNYIDYMERK